MKNHTAALSLALAAGMIVLVMPRANAQALKPGPFNTVPTPSSQSLPAVGAWSPTTSVGTNVNATNAAGSQSETSVAVDPTNAKHVLLSVNDLGVNPIAASVAESFDGGLTFTRTNVQPGVNCYDTWLGFNSNGDSFMSFECLDQRIAYKKVGQTSWTATKLTNAGSSPDRDMMTVDNSPTSPFFGSVYIGYDDNGNNNAPYVLYSRDGFGTWTRSPKIATGNPTIGVNVTTGPDGTVYAAWEDYSGGNLYIASSKDGAVTWGPKTLVTKYRIATSGFFIFIPPQNTRGILPFPMTATAQAGAHTGRVYITYTDKDPVLANTNIYVRYSDDGGATWSTESKVNDDTTNAYHFQPQISISPRGLVGVSFYDTRHDVNNKRTDRYFSSSQDGVTWKRNIRVTSAQSNEAYSGVNGNQYGDYQGIYADGSGRFWLSWTDSRKVGATLEDEFGAQVTP